MMVCWKDSAYPFERHYLHRTTGRNKQSPEARCSVAALPGLGLTQWFKCSQFPERTAPWHLYGRALAHVSRLTPPNFHLVSNAVREGIVWYLLITSFAHTSVCFHWDKRIQWVGGMAVILPPQVWKENDWRIQSWGRVRACDCIWYTLSFKEEASHEKGGDGRLDMALT